MKTATAFIFLLLLLDSRAQTVEDVTAIQEGNSILVSYSPERNNSKYISALQLFSGFRENVLNNSPNAPQYGVIQDTGDEGGEFIFILK